MHISENANFDTPISFFFFGFLYLCYGRGDAAGFKGLTPVRLPLQGRQMEDVRPKMVFYCLFYRGGTTANKHGCREYKTTELNDVRVLLTLVSGNFEYCVHNGEM